MSEVNSHNQNKKRFSVFNIVGLFIYIVALLLVVIGSPIGGDSGSMRDFRLMDIMMIIINMMLFMELFYFEENDIFHQDMMKRKSTDRLIDFALRGIIFFIMVEWLVIRIFNGTVFYHLIHAVIISTLIIFWSSLFNRDRESIWRIFTGDSLVINQSFNRFMFPFWSCLFFSILLIIGTTTAKYPEIINSIMSFIPFLDSSGVVKKEDIVLLVNRSSGAMIITLLGSTYILRAREWHMTLFEGRCL
ncbi:MAG: hypothetical protein JRE64_00680 [Deltaproteobacteria bacterium]|nr:hypothetical protein [Deltaproteobacteria bacterium]